VPKPKKQFQTALNWKNVNSIDQSHLQPLSRDKEAREAREVREVREAREAGG